MSAQSYLELNQPQRALQICELGIAPLTDEHRRCVLAVFVSVSRCCATQIRPGLVRELERLRDGDQSVAAHIAASVQALDARASVRARARDETRRALTALEALRHGHGLTDHSQNQPLRAAQSSGCSPAQVGPLADPVYGADGRLSQPWNA